MPHVPVPPFLESAELISQGAEALVFIHNNEIVKFRPEKPWRLPDLDKQLRKRRTNQEARVLEKLANENLPAPKLVQVNASSGLITMELIQGESLKAATWNGTLESVLPFYGQLGKLIAQIHNLDIVHGDLTTSNAMVRPNNNTKTGGEVVLIDFGLSSRAASIEDKAVDLYVLERAIQSTHPLEAAKLSHEVLSVYEAETSEKNRDLVLSRLKIVRQRGRKRTQLG